MEIKTVHFDAMSLSTAPSVSYFEKKKTTAAPAIGKLNESDIIKWLFRKNMVRELFYNEIFPEAPQVAFGIDVKTSLISSKSNYPGDIDILTIQSSDPRLAFALQCKRVTATFEEGEDKIKLGKLDEIDTLINQTNAQVGHGFAGNYLCLMIICDCRKSGAANVLVNALGNDDLRDILAAFNQKKLSKKAGIVLLFVTQAMDKSIEYAGEFGIFIARRPRRVEQPAELSQSLEMLFCDRRITDQCSVRRIKI